MVEISSLRIGVLTTDPLRGAAREFFELFKTPWAFANDTDDHFPATLASASLGTTPLTPLFICTGPHAHPIDVQLGISLETLTSGKLVKLEESSFPVHTGLARLNAPNCDVFLRTEDGLPVAVTATHPGITVVRIGYDLFAEVDQLITEGQSPAHASSPSLELHIEVLRTVLLAHGLPVVEIVARPHGHPFAVCLTHDIDFISIRDHVFDHTFFGFAYRVLRSLVARPRNWGFIFKNLRAFATVPAVHLGLAEDFWYPMARYSAAEGHHPSTYFFIPFAGRRGKHADGPRGHLRAAPYDVTRYATDLQELEKAGREVAVHGIDAWCDDQEGRSERRVIEQITRRPEYGIRMHWLYYSSDSPQHLEAAGFAYDSTLGYNDAVGYRNGTTQVFRPSGASTLVELPLNVQDTALFFPDRMRLTFSEALERCRDLMNTNMRFGGVLTVNWHDRSLAPERNWDGFYRRLLHELDDLKPWFAQARDVIAWFARRRNLTFRDVRISNDRAVISLDDVSGSAATNLPPLCLRVLVPVGHEPEDGLRSATRVQRRALEIPVTSHEHSINIGAA